MPADERCQNAGVSAGFIRSDNSSKLGVYASSHAAGRGVVALCVSYLAWNEENLLLKTQIRVEAGSLVAEETKEPLAGITHRPDCAVERRLLVEGVAVVAHEARRHVDRVSAQENRRGRVDAEVAARRVRSAEAAVRERRAVGFALEQILTLEIPLGGARLHVEVKHTVVHLPRLAMTNAIRRHGLKPVRVHARAVGLSPRQHRGGYLERTKKGASRVNFIMV